MPRMKKLALILIGILLSGISQGATVTWNAFGDTGLILPGTPSSADALGLTNWVQIGYFRTLTDGQVTANAATLAGTATLAADFFTFGKLQISASGSNPSNSELGASGPGGWQQNTTNFSYASNTTFIPGHQAYIWMMNSTNNSSLASAQANVTSQAIFTLSSWLFPANDLSFVNIELQNLSTASGAALSSGTLFGTYQPATSNTNLAAAGVLSPRNAVQLAAVVPEPSTIVLGAVAALIAAGRRKRRRA